MIYENEILKNYINTHGTIEFIFNEEDLNEAFYIKHENSSTLSIMVRTKKDDGLNHHRTFKLKTKDIRRYFKYGLPIVFDKEIKNGKVIWNWKIDPSINPTRETRKLIGKKESEFIDAVLKVAGDDMLEYWSSDDDNRRREIANKYNK